MLVIIFCPNACLDKVKSKSNAYTNKVKSKSNAYTVKIKKQFDYASYNILFYRISGQIQIKSQMRIH